MANVSAEYKSTVDMLNEMVGFIDKNFEELNNKTEELNNKVDEKLDLFGKVLVELVQKIDDIQGQNELYQIEQQKRYEAELHERHRQMQNRLNTQPMLQAHPVSGVGAPHSHAESSRNIAGAVAGQVSTQGQAAEPTSGRGLASLFGLGK